MIKNTNLMHLIQKIKQIGIILSKKNKKYIV